METKSADVMDFTEVCLHEMTLNLHTHALIFSHLSIVSVDCKQHFSKVVFGALVGFSLKGKLWVPGLTHKRKTHNQ